MTIVNTTFFFPPHKEEALRQWLRQIWMPMVEQVGCSRPTCLKMDSADDGIERMALHTEFPAEAEARQFLECEFQQMISDLHSTFGPETVAAFPTLLHQIDL